MNFLAHAYLSLRQPDLLVGNLISDFVKGKSKFDFPEAVQKGIQLHRAIDTFTDEHPVNIHAKKIFRPAVGLYAGAFLDVVYDHFLANDSIAFPGEGLGAFSQWVYSTMGERLDVCPDKFVQIFPYMKSQDWLFNYSHRWGIERSMEGLVRRAKYLDESQPAYLIFEKEFEFLQHSYLKFFPSLMLFVNNYYRHELQQKP